jgi:hypothetical protein
VTLNARGYRGREAGAAPSAGRTRVVVLGDSVAFGHGVADDETFPHLLEARDPRLEVFNLGVEGYGPGQELLVLEREGLPVRPDLVILAFCLRNDFVDAVLNVALYDGVTPRPRFQLVNGRLVLDDRAVRRGALGRGLQWVSDHSYLVNGLSGLLPRGEGREDPGWRVRKQEALRDEDHALGVTLALVLEMASRCRSSGAAFLVATFPNGLGYAMRPEIAVRFHESLRAAGVAVVEMGPHFQARGATPAQLALDRTGHLRPAGHALAAEILGVEIAARFAGREASR